MEFERVYCNQNAANVGVNVARVEPLPQILQQRRLVQVRQLAQVGIFTVFRLQQERDKVAQQLRVQAEIIEPGRGILLRFAQVKPVKVLFRVLGP